jgi:hypothetical protein
VTLTLNARLRLAWRAVNACKNQQHAQQGSQQRMHQLDAADASTPGVVTVILTASLGLVCHVAITCKKQQHTQQGSQWQQWQQRSTSTAEQQLIAAVCGSGSKWHNRHKLCISDAQALRMVCAAVPSNTFPAKYHIV